MVAFSNGKKKAILIRAADKREIQEKFREAGKSQLFAFRVFALPIFLLLKDEKFQEVIIDTEYPGRGDIIKNYLLEAFRKIGRKVDSESIHFHFVGKSCEAHWHGYYVFKGKRKPELTVDAKGILKEIFH